MSSLPGYRLEDFLAWELNLVIEDMSDANFSLQVAEMLGNIPSRPSLTQEQFKTIVALFEEYRHDVEAKLDTYDEDRWSWRDYAGYSFDCIPDETYSKAKVLITNFNN